MLYEVITDGMPASSSTADLMVRDDLSSESSARKTPTAMPVGTAMASARPVTRKEPTMNDIV